MASFQEPYLPKFGALPREQSGAGGLGEAMQGFGDALKHIQVQRSLNSATEEIQGLQQAEASDSEIRKRQSELAQQLGQQMIGFGYPAAQTKLATGLINPKDDENAYTNEVDLFTRGKPEEVKRYLDSKQQEFAWRQKHPDPGDAAIKQQKLDDAEFATKVKVLGGLRKATNEAEASSRNTLGTLAQRANTLTDLNGLFTNPGLTDEARQAEWNRLTRIHIQEMATGLDRVFKGGVATETGTDGLTPHDLEMKKARLIELGSSKPTPANQGEFVALYNEIIQRTGNILEAQIRGYKKNTLAAIPSIAKKYTDDFPELSRGMLGESAHYENGKVVFESDADEAKVAQKINDLDGAKGMTPQQQLIALKGIENDPHYWDAVMRTKPLVGKMRMIRGRLQGAQ